MSHAFYIISKTHSLFVSATGVVLFMCVLTVLFLTLINL
ncbi:hypothetical protein VCRA2126O298_170088 [Vibrio crassostreae]|nr:hypothetical protein VCRA2126O293_140122 [Vibrio crassostreae]CAK3103581.1 hypothetical protein VCRA2123O280_130005 [Vibrio crassostreae]CAK3179855.1 hypothetical protein VCRA2126O292_110122 [Vibrio crassostreae]CAK3200483.1 hypothetical protein VCRA2126O298_170088 [Vibrio crassostreae]CAK3206947.1 hypothetical protein VCRA2126O295_130005 [Vibrio crassostreae]